MSVSEVQIVNMALVRIGEPMITDLNEDVKPARVASALYPTARDAVLRLHPWSVAIKRIELAASSTPPAYGWARQFQLPSDFIRLVETFPRAPYEIENGFLVTDSQAMMIRYVWRLEDTSRYDPLLVRAIAAKLAIDINMAVTRDTQRNQMLQEEYNQRISDARFTNAIEQWDKRISTQGWVQSRNYGVIPEDERYQPISPVDE